MGIAEKAVTGGTAPTTNVALCMKALERAIHRPGHLYGMVGFYGPSGYGKSFGAAYSAARYRAYYVECRESWSRKAFLENLLAEMRVKTAGKTVAHMTAAAAEQLALAQIAAPKPLIIDEADKAVDHKYIEIIRDLLEGSGGAPILLIGEEKLETKLRDFERMHNRVIEWLPAQPASGTDARALAKLYCADLDIGDDLLAKIHTATHGVTRRICINLDRVSEVAAQLGKTSMTLADWGLRPIYTGEAPRRVIK